MPEYRSDMTVKLVQHLGDEKLIMDVAKISTLAGASFDESAEQKDPARFVKWLMREKHGSPFEHPVMTFYLEVPIFVSRQIVKYRHSCLAGDTKIYFESSNGNVYWKTIADHWEDWHNGIKTESKLGTPFRRHLPSVRNATVRSINEKTLRKELSSVNDVVKSGEKEVFEVHSTSGQSVTASADHLFYTPKGWRRLKEMQVGDEVYFQGRGFPGVTPETRAVRAEAITSIESRGVQMTYDLCLDAPHHNFFANGYVVHNSINESSGRYSVLEGTFYVPDDYRPLVQIGKTGDYQFEQGTDYQRETTWLATRNAALMCWDQYQLMLEDGIAKEVARMVLPVNTYSQMVVTANLRTWLHFVAQRASEAPSHGQYEIAMVADQIGLVLQEHFPNVWQEFVEGGYQRV